MCASVKNNNADRQALLTRYPGRNGLHGRMFMYRFFFVSFEDLGYTSCFKFAVTHRR